MFDSNTSNDLIKSIEEDALESILNINIPQDSEKEITLDIVYSWYLETEKLIRILANTLPSTMSQPINQLRYAGHHILKSQITCCSKSQISNLIEAYKHCKRGYFDAIDLYVFHTSSTFKEKFAFLPKETVIEYSKKLESHIKSIDELRLESDCRIDYYSGVANKISDGLKIINSINIAMTENGITEDFLKSQKQLLNENKSLREQVDKKLNEANKRFNLYAVLLTVVIVLATSIGLVFDGFATQWLLNSNIELNITNTPVIEYKDLDKTP